jgi:hypothetical protein
MEIRAIRLSNAVFFRDRLSIADAPSLVGGLSYLWPNAPLTSSIHVGGSSAFLHF